MARLPYGPVLLLLDDIVYVCCYSRTSWQLSMTEVENPQGFFDF